MPKKKISPLKAEEKIAAYCAYQERCKSEIKTKLEEYGYPEEKVDLLLQRLALEGFLNENRFASAFVRGKFSIKKWGKVRIRQELKLREIPEIYIKSALNEINEEEYWETLIYLTERKWRLTKETNPLKKKAKVQRFLMFRGFEQDLIKEAMDQVNEETS
ncbi:regulatory protein RecX [Pleomorphovibrio marinus]|uniref:regulatory protein RecX n=1 Tax=Pleomorphovibrio marinus TaxID=2164132 RepID=UPI001E31F44B|nr:regulatory protein RecX [Pleomorphovibrio marinus]